MAFMTLLLVSVMTSGQYLLTSTVEEKSNRVVEVLLSAVSAMELMTGQDPGPDGRRIPRPAAVRGPRVAGAGVVRDARPDRPVLIVFLLIFYVLAFFMFASLMAAVGAAVNEMREAQSMMMPIMMVLMVPMDVVAAAQPRAELHARGRPSFVPPFSNFVMLLRMASHVAAADVAAVGRIAIGAGGRLRRVWFAAKVFRVGLLMYGKPPTFGTLVKWARMS